MVLTAEEQKTLNQLLAKAAVTGCWPGQELNDPNKAKVQEDKAAASSSQQGTPTTPVGCRSPLRARWGRDGIQMPDWVEINTPPQGSPRTSPCEARGYVGRADMPPPFPTNTVHWQWAPPTPLPLEFPRGIDSIGLWGHTKVTFGNTWTGCSYNHVYDHATESQLSWYRHHASSGSCHLRDFGEYIRARTLLLGPPGMPEGSYFPGSTVYRTFVPVSFV